MSESTENAADTELDAEGRGMLNQAEIDSLMRFDEPARSGMERLIRSGLISYERLPMLEIIFDRLVRILSTSLRNFTSDNAEATIESITSARLGDYLANMPVQTMLAVFRADEWDNSGLLTLDSSMIYNMIDLVLGGRHGRALVPPDNRPYTPIERGLVERLVNVILADFTTSFTPVSKVRFRFDRLETNPRFAVISRVSNAAILARLRIDMEGRSGIIEILLPYATLEPVRDLLLQKFMGEKFGRDHIWESHLTDELRTTEVELDALLDEQPIRLSDILNLRPGMALPISIPMGSEVKLRCGGVPLFTASLGNRQSKLALTITAPIIPPSQGKTA
jgi:flagellar motor switch protein FliM